VTSNGSAYARFRRAIERGHLFHAETAARELPQLNLSDALDYCDLLARQAPERFERAALRWHGRFEVEGKAQTLLDAHHALLCLQMLTGSDRALALSVLRHLAKR